MVIINPGKDSVNLKFRIFRVLQNYYTVPESTKSPELIESEKWLVRDIVKFNRWFLLPAAFLIQFCCGSLYAWSVFNKPIDNYIFGDPNYNASPTTFYIAIGLLGVIAAIMGPWIERHGPTKGCMVGASLILTGNLLTALALHLKLIWLVYFGYGFIGGCGVGICYISPVSTLQKWFPDRRGLGAGFAVCGTGAGAIAIAKIPIPLIGAVGLPWTFVLLGVSYFVVMGVCAIGVLRTPPPDFELTFQTNDNEAPPTAAILMDLNFPQEQAQLATINPTTMTMQFDLNPPQQLPPSPPPQEKLTLRQAIASRDFILILIMFTGNILFGLVIISRLSNMITDIFNRPPEEASTIVSINGGFNLGGRLIIAFVSDYVGRKNCFIVMLTTQLIILGCFSLMTNAKAYWALVFCMWTVTACYASGFGVIPAFLTDKFGASNTGACHGIVLTGWSAGAVIGGVTFTTVFDYMISLGYTAHDTWPYNVNVWWIFGIVSISWISIMFVKPTELDKKFNRRLICCRK